ncbi:MAG: UDP-galactopyranose mutase [Verrucomicrobia bacterium]|nr:UDP-galactopyranose mutase [Verrucomicrobiota bacterium]
MKPFYDLLIVGAGFSGAVLAERFARALGKRSLVVDRLGHVGGHAHDCFDAAGVLIHAYGPHYFRTNSKRVQEYLSNFTSWRPVEYKILSYTDGRFWNFPINLNTFEQFLGRGSTTQEMEETLARWRIPIDQPRNSEEAIVSRVGHKLYEKFYKNYTRKQWGRDPSELAAGVCGRIPIRTNRDDRYLTEEFQAMPAEGYTALIQQMLDHPNIDVELGVEFKSVAKRISFQHLIYTGPIDGFFDYRFGSLPYRSLRFERETLQQEFYQPAVQVNYPNDYDFTRIVETKHITGQKLSVTTIVREYPDEFGPGKEPYYPIPAPDTQVLYRKYAELSASLSNVTFIGRLATYRYYNMDQAINMALSEFERISGRVEGQRSELSTSAALSGRFRSMRRSQG